MKSLAKRLEPIFRRYRVPFAYLWGSRARGRARPDSDYDIAVSLPPRRRALDRFLDLSAAISEALETDDVDVTWLEEATPEVRFVVLQRGRLIYDADPEARVRFACLSWKIYWDEQPRLARHDRAVWQHVQDGTFGT